MFQLPNRSKKYSQGVTLIELLVTLAIVAILVFPLFITYRTARNNQALRVSGEELAGVLTQAHIHARDARDKKGWGVKRTSPQNYVLISGEKEANDIVQNMSLDHSVRFQNDFFIWFNKGTGESDSSAVIYLNSENGQKMQIDVLKSGVVEVQKL